MLNWLRKLLVDPATFPIKEIIANRVDLRPGEHLFVVIKSDSLDYDDMVSIRQSMCSSFPANKVGLFLIGEDDDIKFSTVNPETKSDKKESEDGTTNG